MLISKVRQQGDYIKSENGKQDVYQFYQVGSQVFVFSSISASWSACGHKIEATPIDKFE